MKTLITGFGSLMILILATMVQFSIVNSSVRQNELDSAINNAMVETQRTLLDENSSITSNAIYQDEFTNNLLNYITSDSEIHISFITSDYTNGLLDVEVSEVYYYNDTAGNPTSRTYTTRRTNVIDKHDNGSYDASQELDLAFIRFNLASGIKIDLTGKLDDGTTDPNANILTEYIVENGFAETTIRIKEGTVHSVTSSEGTLTYEVVSHGGNQYLHINVTGISNNVTITVN